MAFGKAADWRKRRHLLDPCGLIIAIEKRYLKKKKRGILFENIKRYLIWKYYERIKQLCTIYQLNIGNTIPLQNLKYHSVYIKSQLKSITISTLGVKRRFFKIKALNAKVREMFGIHSFERITEMTKNSHLGIFHCERWSLVFKIN